jgi:hypothetical protein
VVKPEILSVPVLRRVLKSLCIAASTAACVKHLPPAPAPAAVVPAIVLPAEPPAPGMGRIVVDVVDGPSHVQHVQVTPRAVTESGGRTVYHFDERPQQVCAITPCVAEVPLGNVLLGFSVIGNRALESELVHIGPDPSVYRRTLSVYEDRTGALRVAGIVMTAVGVAAAITGAAIVPAGQSRDNSALTMAGGITLGSGVALLVLGILAIRHDAPTLRPGSATHFSLADAPR